MIKVGIVGGSGYTGGELLRLLSTHPEARVVCVTSRKLAGKPVEAVHEHLRALYDLKFEAPAAQEVAQRCDIVFTAVPHGTAMDWVPALLDAGTKVIDLSSDYRLPVDVFEKTYGMKHKAPRQAVFGLPELHPEVASARLVGNPGCYPTGATLALAPLAAAGMVDRVVFDSKSGISGAGVEPTETSHYPNLAQNIRCYKVTSHRHVPEIKQELGKLQSDIRISFTPHVIAAVRGILTTAHVFVKPGFESKIQDKAGMEEMYRQFYAKSRFVRMTGTVPMLMNVRGSNFCDIGLEPEKGTDRLVVISAIDNLVKGAAGQAIQNMNIMMGIDETAGLWFPGGAP
ncbi:MAG: Aspartate-semialdehyde dehydrogenase [Methanosaeta sp. PtaB.Bin039]|nr:MAG: Aspartate-semialdehyde dehydrogenase [Methanosaeta sp. PtaB.Bin039]HOT05972.1 N-acetyl-gamma-glutamyl-phosphate reductase [Methanotrichaceae archaeon]HQF16824.1 N-acetyl-gamma-glutamyl-phosphate reductase [Methanotrichaceae archaeon]HQI90150.1 N-acetyl-gamma-glutamyl-phosphate reductase [Methanotrichaceae archaeon]HQJ29128.1 N-acetyl-gamma-glutamyl-phosphate reductase [Methanotrichaceae archaeon]